MGRKVVELREESEKEEENGREKVSWGGGRWSMKRKKKIGRSIG